MNIIKSIKSVYNRLFRVPDESNILQRNLSIMAGNGNEEEYLDLISMMDDELRHAALDLYKGRYLKYDNIVFKVDDVHCKRGIITLYAKEYKDNIKTHVNGDELIFPVGPMTTLSHIKTVTKTILPKEYKNYGKD